MEWAFRYCGQFTEVATILSGMSTMEQVKDNLRIFENVAPGNLSDEDLRFVAQLKEAYVKRMKVGCTTCGYCQPCPEGVRIPQIFDLYNEAHMLGRQEAMKQQYQQLIKAQADGSLCLGCGQCEALCPQQLPIINWLAAIDQEVRPDAV